MLISCPACRCSGCCNQEGVSCRNTTSVYVNKTVSRQHMTFTTQYFVGPGAIQLRTTAAMCTALVCFCTLQVLSVIPFRFVPEPVLIKVANHTECKCMEPAIIRRNAQPHRSGGWVSSLIFLNKVCSNTMWYKWWLLFDPAMSLVDWQLFSKWPPVRGLQATVCDWVDLGLLNRPMHTIPCQSTWYVYVFVFVSLCFSVFARTHKHAPNLIH